MRDSQKIKVNLFRSDATNAFLARSLEHIDPVDYYELTSGLLSRKMVPLIEGINPAKDVYTYKMIELVGQAALGAPGKGSNDEQPVGVRVTEASHTIKEIPVTMEWTNREIEQAAETNTPLDNWTIAAGMTSVARKIDHMLAFGDANVGITGLLNTAGVSSSTATTKTGGQIEWTAATPAQEMLNDLNLLVAEAHAACLQASRIPGADQVPAFERFTIGMPTFHYGLAMTTPRATGSDMSVLSWFLANNRWVDAVEEWNLCDIASSVGGTAGVDGGPKMVCYPRTPLAVGGIAPRDWKQLAPQLVGQKVVVPASGLCGGTAVRYKMAVRYMNLTD